MKILIGLLVFISCYSCSKELLPNPKPVTGELWLYRYTIDTVLVQRTDGVPNPYRWWHQDSLSEKSIQQIQQEINKAKADPSYQWITFCSNPDSRTPTFMLERRIYVLK